MIKPMLCHDTKGDFGLIPPDWVIEPKLDGWRWIVDRTADGVKSFGGRNAADHSGQVPAIAGALDWLPVGTVLDCELAPLEHGLGSPAVSSALANGGDGLVLIVFDVLRLSGTDVCGLPWYQRREMLDLMATRFDNHLVTAASYTAANLEQHEAWLAAGFEGCVAKKRDSTYRPGKRSRDWLKVKPQSTAEAVVTGWVYGKGASNQEFAGALKLRMLDSGAETTCGFHATPADADLMVDRLIEIRHHGIGESGKPRHPIFSRVREDLEQGSLS
ncbi:ATP-dependent DNA ligase [uncultured Caudovirales phage]|uniref:DNA ligase n=1 Tax=uncultured Caudovirales phage TaxID=2100421 RepID=A0A6J5RKX0_9CAUD|nr:ATP-dependent DNA ligase [uncultured Caudovirales phage]